MELESEEDDEGADCDGVTALDAPLLVFDAPLLAFDAPVLAVAV